MANNFLFVQLSCKYFVVLSHLSWAAPRPYKDILWEFDLPFSIVII